MTKRVFFIVWVVFMVGCSRVHQREEAALPPLEVPPSYLSFRVDFPIQELAKGVNRILPGELVDGVFPMGEKDSLYLKVNRKGPLDLYMKGDEFYAAIPLEVSAAVRKKVLGITLSNKESPVVFHGKIKASTSVAVAPNWSLDLACTYRGFELTDSPELSLMGMTFNVEELIETALQSHEEELSNVICRALDHVIDFRQLVDKVWSDLQNPIRVARSPQPFWLYSRPLALNGVVIPGGSGTLSIHLEYRTRLQISPELSPVTEKVQLGDCGEPLNTRNTIAAYTELYLPFEMLTHLMQQELAGKTFTYEDYTLLVEQARVNRKGQKLLVALDVSGDITGKVLVTGTPTINDNRELTISDFKYEIEAEDDWVKLTDWAVHSLAEQYIADQARLDTRPFFRQLDQLIMQGLRKSDLAEKLDVDLVFQKIDSYQLRMTETYIQWIFYLEGSSSVTLKSGLFKKR
ncbi:DUF4403 family protein [Marinoscillum furvescens]|uniref:Uncharacterized protein DUF4403 n=1 Tax=Marinoscillum furvescens DSM 4134 TaxID=1122208 RepID=A0A3D9L7W1_MARFU|nr:DUF4403 family protein [Marinoscillum furvescens]REE01575.1 uncharacterized protein DUF4403 [Marinoscillum furvescens DSM 4134]